ncbi:OmpA family protein [bacterium]|nr:OmpA family protein [bacterium]
MKTLKWIFITVLVFTFLTPDSIAGSWTQKTVLRGGLAGYFPYSSNLGRVDAGGLLKVNYSYGFTRQIFAEASVGFGMMPFMRANLSGVETEKGYPIFLPFNLNISYLLIIRQQWDLFLIGGLGFYPLTGMTFSGDQKDLSSAGTGWGFRFCHAANISNWCDGFYVEALGHYWAEEGAFTMYKGTSTFIEISAGLTYWFGGRPIPRPPRVKGLPPTIPPKPAPPEKPVPLKPAPPEKPLDSDGDGVPDMKDKSPNTPEGVKVDEHGRPLDTDMDAVPDYLDMEPNTPIGVKVDVRGRSLDTDSDGVPDYRDRELNTPAGNKVDENGVTVVADTDGDGVPDNIDREKNTPRGAAVDQYGVALPKVPEGILKSVTFEINKTQIKPESHPELTKLADALKANPNVVIELRGYTDSTGSSGINLKLSQARVESVKKFLVGKGIADNRIQTKGLGATNFINTQNTKAAENRRVEVIIVKR